MNKLINLCQLAFKSHNVVMGDRLIPGIQAREVYLVIFSSELGKNRLKKLKNKCTFYEIPWMEIDALEYNSITNKAIQSFGVTDKRFAQEILEKGQVSANGIQS